MREEDSPGENVVNASPGAVSRTGSRNHIRFHPCRPFAEFDAVSRTTERSIGKLPTTPRDNERSRQGTKGGDREKEPGLDHRAPVIIK